MKKALMIPFAVAALSAAPLSFAQANDYLAQRQNLDSPAHIQAVARQAIAQGEQARGNSQIQGHTQGQARDYLAERQDLDQGAAIADAYRDLQAQQAVVKAEGNPEGTRDDYLNERRSLDNQDHIQRVLFGQS